MSIDPSPSTAIDRRDREGYFYGTTSPYWHDQLRLVFQHVDAAGVGYCILHGYGGYDGVESGDIDCIVLDRDLPHRFGRALQAGVRAEGCRLINWYHRGQHGHVFVLARENESGFDFFWLDVCDSDYEGPWRYYSGPEMLSRKRRANGFWATAPGIEFACYVTIKVTKRLLTEAHGSRLSRLYAAAPEECRTELRRFYGPRSTALICQSAETNEWDGVRRNFDALDNELRGYGLRRSLWQPHVAATYLVGEALRKAQRSTLRTGLHLNLEGDAATAEPIALDLARLLAPAFRSVRLSRGRGKGKLMRAMGDRLLLSRTGLLITPGGRDFSRGAGPDLTVKAGDVELKKIASQIIDLLEERTRKRLDLP